ncbi:hypothetical protein DL770_005561 [Monosporascus sp. CRB-9-2]|nr:hypothetical protein DL770_005561 [Monosporascus sp. CRB-9-2]
MIPEFPPETPLPFWQALDVLVASHDIIIDRPRGTAHPRYPDDIYPLDYGFLRGTSAGDGEGIDLWLGTLEGKRVCGVIVTVDLLKGDSEIKLLLSCTAEEMREILGRHSKGKQSAMLIEREGVLATESP